MLKAEKVADALKKITQAALLSHVASDWRNVASLAARLGDSPRTCCALDEFFKQKVITSGLDAWYLYVKLIHTAGDYPLL